LGDGFIFLCLSQSPAVGNRRFFIFAFGAGGVIQPFLILYLKESGLDGIQIGVIQGRTALISVLAACKKRLLPVDNMGSNRKEWSK